MLRGAPPSFLKPRNRPLSRQHPPFNRWIFAKTSYAADLEFFFFSALGSPVRLSTIVNIEYPLRNIAGGIEYSRSIRFDRPRQPARFRGKLLRRFCSASSIINTAVTARNWRGNNGETREPYHRPNIFGYSSVMPS